MTAFPTDTHSETDSIKFPSDLHAPRCSLNGSLVRPARRRRGRLRFGQCVLMATLALPSLSLAADEQAQEADSKPGITSKLFRLPSFLNRLPLPRLSRQPDRTAVAEPKPSTNAELIADSGAGAGDSPQMSQRILDRSRQLMSDARQLESRGHLDAALDLARRADAVYATSQAMAPIPWPAGEQLPDQYVVSLTRKIEANPTTPPAATAGLILPPPSEASSQSRPDSGADAARQLVELLPTNLPPAQNLLPSIGKLEQNSQLLLDWGRRGIAVAETVQDVKQAVEEKRIDDLTEIALAGTAVVVEAVANASSPATGGQTPGSEESDNTVRDLLRDQLKRLEGWHPDAPSATEPLQPLKDDGESTPFLLPQNQPKTAEHGVGRVSPIPTEAGDPELAAAPVVTIPAQPPIPMPGGVEPRLLNEPAADPAVPGPPSPVLGQPVSDPVWYVALVQMLSTFFGAALALVAFMLLRGVLKRETTQATSIGPAAGTVKTPVVAPVVSSGEHGIVTSDDDTSIDDETHVVPFKRAIADGNEADTTERRAA
jgi:hypothetical protein